MGKRKSSLKKAELTTQQIVVLIVLLVSFIILLLFLFKLNFQELSEKEICQSSIQLNSKATVFGKIDCKINYLCISGGGECKSFTSKKIANIDLKDKETAKKEIMKILAEEMADCWWMFGEGKVDYIGTGAFDQRACAVCSEIAFDEKIIFSGLGVISYKEFYEFLNKEKRGTTQKTYLAYWDNLAVDKLDSTFLSSSIAFDKKYGIYTGRDKTGKLLELLPWVTKDTKGDPKEAISPVLLDRTNSNQLKCTYFVTTP